MEAPSSASGGPRAGSAAASGGPRAGSGGSGGPYPELARFLELEPADRIVEFQEIMTELVTEATEYQITSAAWLEHIETHSFTTELRTENFIAEVTQTVSRIETVKADPKKDFVMHLVEVDSAVLALQEKWGELQGRAGVQEERH